MWMSAASTAVTAVLATGGAGMLTPPGVLSVDDASLLPRLVEAGLVAWHSIVAWAIEGYAKAPAVMAGLAAALAVPLLAALGALARLAGGGPNMRAATAADRGETAAWPHSALIRIEGGKGPHPLTREMLRIGRQDDNDLCLADTTVHRYHAVIHRTPEADFVITDLSGPDGNGVRVNGERIAQLQLLDGDAITIGAVRLTFESQPL